MTAAVQTPVSIETDFLAEQFVALAGLELDSTQEAKLVTTLSTFLDEYTEAVVLQTVQSIAQRQRTHRHR